MSKESEVAKKITKAVKSVDRLVANAKEVLEELKKLSKRDKEKDGEK